MTIATIVEKLQVSDRRQDVRWCMRFELPGSHTVEAKVIIHDLSTAGMLIETKSQLQVGQSIAIALPEAEDATARILWQNDRHFGCRFDQPLSQATISAARLRNPISAADRSSLSSFEERETLSERLLRLRRAKGMSQTALSARTGFSKPSIWAWETGKTVPRRANLRVLAEVFGLTEQQLYLGDEEVRMDAPENDTDYSAGRLHHVIEEARSQIAAMAGVTKSMVRISIDF